MMGRALAQAYQSTTGQLKQRKCGCTALEAALGVFPATSRGGPHMHVCVQMPSFHTDARSPAHPNDLTVPLPRPSLY